MIIVNYLFYALFLLSMGYYAITNLQWYSYKLERVIFHHTKTWWHFVYFIWHFFTAGTEGWTNHWYGQDVSNVFMLSWYFLHSSLRSPLGISR